MVTGAARRLSVVIPAYNSCDTLDLVLEALGRQTVPADQFEVVVGDDGSNPPLASVVEKHADRIDVSCVYLETTRAAAPTAMRRPLGRRGRGCWFSTRTTSPVRAFQFDPLAAQHAGPAGAHVVEP
ncbi:glycosyltransferase [Micromonospora matsumotoense]|uniref:glycosyltransferase n=1 Tax=Micromonospora matsumotoense TaxID=121616 RepID=UPI0033F693E7